MYHPNQSPPSRRAGEEFLRRMSFRELESCPSCAASNAQSVPVFNPLPTCADKDCSASKCASMPALAMVYSPVQEWGYLMEGCEEALAHGTLFRELWKPFEAGDRRKNTYR